MIKRHSKLSTVATMLKTIGFTFWLTITFWGMLYFVVPAAGQQQQPSRVIRVNYGYFQIPRPLIAACARGWLDLYHQQTDTLYKVVCHPQTSGNFAASRLDNLQLDIAHLGSTPWAQAAARGVDAKVIYISQYTGESQGIYTRPSEPNKNYTGIATPFDLEGRRIGVPFGSTIHYQLLFLIDLLGFKGSVELINMSPTNIMAAWDDPARNPPLIDAAGCWGVFRDYVLRGGKNSLPANTLVSAGGLSDWGRPTFVVVAATRTFARKHPDFVDHFVGIISRINDSFLDNLGEKDDANARRWDANAPAGVSYLPSMVDALMWNDEEFTNPSLQRIYAERRALNDFIQQSATEQLTCQYLGQKPGACTNPSLLHVATRQTAEFLVDQKVLSQLGPLDILGDDESCRDEATFCGGDLIDGRHLEQAHRNCTACLPIGPYAASVGNVDGTNIFSRGGPDKLLATLERWDIQSNRSPFAPSEIGRNGGDSTCFQLGNNEANVISSGPVIGSFGDGANAEPGRTYSRDIRCTWVIRGVDCSTTSSRCQSIVELSIDCLRIWSADYIRIYTDPERFDCSATLDGSSSRILLAQLSGVYNQGDPDLPPAIRARGCMTVVFESDANQERTYADETGNGFLLTYNRNKEGCVNSSDCSGQPCNSDGLCECGGQRWGADCSETRACLGTNRIILEDGTTQIVASSQNVSEQLQKNSITSDYTRPLDPAETYPNDLDCTFELVVPDGFRFVEVEVLYDLEPSYDLLWLQTGSRRGIGPKPYAVLTGTNTLPGISETYWVPTDSIRNTATLRLTTDLRGRRRGFHATVRAARDRNVFLRPDDGCSRLGQSGMACEFPHCVSQNVLQKATRQSPVSPYLLGRVVSQTSDLSVPAMPWAPNGGCVWPLVPLLGAVAMLFYEIENKSPCNSAAKNHRNCRGLPSGVDNVVAIRLVFNAPLDLEPHPITAIGDKLVIKTRSEVPGKASSDVEFFVEQCDSDEECSFPWQTGVCGERGGCLVRTAVEIPVTMDSFTDSSSDSPAAILVTDRNDGGQEYLGLDFDVLLVSQCPSEDDTTHCVTQGGECIDGFCICGGGIPCSCTCDGEPPNVVSTGVKVGIVVGIFIPIIILSFLLFLWYRRRKIRKSRAQKGIIRIKEAELEEFRNSLVGMRASIKQYVPSLGTGTGMARNTPPRPPPKITWCWRETDTCMNRHSPEAIIGNPSACWIKYDDESNRKLEAAFQKQGGTGECSPLSGYVVNFKTMVQTKTKTKFQRDVQRLVEVPPSLLHTIDLSKYVHFGNLIPRELSEEPQMVLVKGDVIQVTKQRPDGWGFGTKLYHADDALARQLVSVATDGNSVDDSSILTDTGWFLLEATQIPSPEDLAVLQRNVGDAGALDAPPNWEKVADPTVVEQHCLHANDDEYKAVVSSFLSTLDANTVKVLKVERIQNLAMWQSYVVKRQTICYRETNNQTAPEGPIMRQDSNAAGAMKKALERFERRWLFHGTNIEVMDKILQQGFNRSFCGKNATRYGKGVYFARDASYSAFERYAVPDDKGVQYMMACRVVVGEYCKGNYNALTPDLRDAAKNILYDSTVDVLASPSIYVTYHDAQAYPEYLISFRSQKQRK